MGDMVLCGGHGIVWGTWYCVGDMMLCGGHDVVWGT